MRIERKNHVVLLVLLCGLAYGTSAFRLGNAQEAVSVHVDLGQPESIIWPFETSIVGDMGEEGIRISANVGAGWRGQVGGEATYRFDMPQDGRYRFWLYALWFDKCSNAVYAQIDSQDRAILGNDPVCGQWHWTRGFSVQLTKGPHTLKLSNHSDHIALQKMLLITPDWVRPEDCGLVFSDVFYDDFDGCDAGNFVKWQPFAGEWKVLRPALGLRHEQNALIGKSSDKAVILYHGDDWSDYSLHAMVRTVASEDPNAAVGLLFGAKDPGNCYQLIWKYRAGTDTVQMEVRRRDNTSDHVLGSFQVVWPVEQWHKMEIALDTGKIRIIVDEQPQIEIPVGQQITGDIGLCLQGTSTAYFDDIRVRTTSGELTEAD